LEEFGLNEKEEVRYWFLYNLPGIIKILGKNATLIQTYINILQSEPVKKIKVFAVQILHEICQ
jgi:hypothetical protein